MCYQTVSCCTYFLVLGLFKNWNIATLSYKSTTSEAFEEIYQVLLDDIINNMALLVQYGKYGSMKTTYSTTMVYYVIKFVSEAYTLQEYITPDRQISTAGGLVFKVHYLRCMQENKMCYWEKKHQKQGIFFLTLTIVHPCLDVF